MELLTSPLQNPWFMWSAVAGYAFVSVTLLCNDRPEAVYRITGGIIVLLEGVNLFFRILS